MKDHLFFKSLFSFLLLTLMLCSKNVQSQCNMPTQYTSGPTGVSFTGMILPSFIQSLNISSDSAYLVVTSSDGLVVGSAICKKITESIQKRQNPVTNVNNMLRKLKSKIL